MPFFALIGALWGGGFFGVMSNLGYGHIGGIVIGGLLGAAFGFGLAYAPGAIRK